MVQKEGSRELTKKTKGKPISPLTKSTVVIICDSMQLPHHIQ